MIKNVVFDCGQVLIHFDPQYMVERYVTDLDDSMLLQKVVFDRTYWDRLDRGTITDAEVVAAVCARLPERLHAVAAVIYENWIYNIPEVEGMRELIAEIKACFGVKTCLLSDISRYFSEHRHEIAILDEIDALVMSADYGLVKPHRETFENLFAVCDIRPEESVFIDDRATNIAGAAACGMQGYCFDGDVGKLREYLFSVLSQSSNKIIHFNGERIGSHRKETNHETNRA